MRVSSAAALLAAVAAAGCGTQTGEAPRAVEQLAPLSRAAKQRCAALAPRRDVAVLCPTRLTPGAWFVRYQTLRSGRREYLCNLDTKPPGSGEAFHALAGGRRGPFPLSVTASGQWPRDTRLPRDLGLLGERPLEPGQRSGRGASVRLELLRRTTVATHPALLLRVADYPDGGVHGGHLAVVWNQGDAGYALSLHFAERSPRSQSARQSIVLQAAAEMSRFRG